MKGILIVIAVIMLIACHKSEPTPKPRAYPRIEYPAKETTEFNVDSCPFTFRYPVYAEIVNKDEPCWFNLSIPHFNATIHCSYLPVSGREKFDDLVQDAFDIAERINARANYMEEARLTNQQGVDGLVLEWSGPAASPLHFFLTDSTQHFFKGALYFDSTVKPDSLAPIADFLKDDIRAMISSFAWKK